MTLTPENVLKRLEKHPMFENERNLERALVLVDYFSNNFHKSQEDAPSYQWVEVKHKDLKSLIGGRTPLKKIKDALKALGILENGNYKRGEHPYFYRIKDAFRLSRTNPWKARTIKNEDLKKSIERFYKTRKDRFTEKYLDLKELAKQLDYLRIKTTPSLELANQITKPEKFEYYTRIIHTIETKIKVFKYVDDKGGRFYNTFTQLPSKLRKYVVDTETGETEWIECDISNCQPLIIGLMMRNENIDSDDSVLFLELCKSGHIYEYFADTFNMTRKEVKKRFLDTILYTVDNKEYLEEKLKKSKRLTEKEIRQNEFRKIFNTEFPEVYKWLLNKKVVKNGNKKLAIAAQKMESDLMIREVAVSLDIGAFYPVHDCIVCHPQYEKVVVDTIKQKAKELWNIDNIPIKVKPVE